MITVSLFRWTAILTGTLGWFSLSSWVDNRPTQAMNLIFRDRFEAGLNQWTMLGDVATISGFGQPGTASALLTNASPRYRDDFPAPVGQFNVSKQHPVAAGTADSPLDRFLGVSLAQFDEGAVEGSAMKLEIAASAGDLLRFEWNLLTNDYYPDYAFVGIGNQIWQLAQAPQATQPFFTPFFYQTGFQQFSYTFTTSGMFTLFVGVVDVYDTDLSTALVIDNLELWQNSAPSPPAKVFEPSLTGGLLGFILLGLKRLNSRTR